jgi:hypothetical protein
MCVSLACRALGRRLALIVPIVIAVSSPVPAQEPPPAAGDRTAAPSPLEVLTGKEQRMDNCRVPLDKRGPKPRPDACPSAPAG